MDLTFSLQLTVNSNVFWEIKVNTLSSTLQNGVIYRMQLILALYFFFFSSVCVCVVFFVYSIADLCFTQVCKVIPRILVGTVTDVNCGSNERLDKKFGKMQHFLYIGFYFQCIKKNMMDVCMV